MKTKILSVTKDDLIIQDFKSGGKGGQHQNTTNSGIRIIHKDSGAVAECREERSQPANKKKAFKKLVETKEFKKWLNWEIAKILWVEEQVEYEVNNNVKTEVFEDGKWVEKIL